MWLSGNHFSGLDGGTGGLEEERRLAYVGLTRARERAIVSFAANRRIYGNWQSAVPSRFVDELPKDNIVIESAQGLYEGSASGFDGLEDGGTFFSNAGAWRARRRGRIVTLRDADTYPHERNIPEGGYDVGERIFHQKFGYGRILSIDGEKLEIAFEKAGTKKVMMSFVEAL